MMDCFNAKELNDQLLKVQGKDNQNQHDKMPKSLFEAIKNVGEKKITGMTEKKPEENEK
jgi:hypothetical protein